MLQIEHYIENRGCSYYRVKYLDKEGIQKVSIPYPFGNAHMAIARAENLSKHGYNAALCLYHKAYPNKEICDSMRMFFAKD